MSIDSRPSTRDQRTNEVNKVNVVNEVNRTTTCSCMYDADIIRCRVLTVTTSRSLLVQVTTVFSNIEQNTAHQSPHNADIARHCRHRFRHHATSTPRPTARDASDIARHRRHRVRHAGDHATPLRPSIMATRPHTNAASLCRDGSRSSRDIHDATTQHLLNICSLLIKSAKNLISLLLKNR